MGLTRDKYRLIQYIDSEYIYVDKIEVMDRSIRMYIGFTS